MQIILVQILCCLHHLLPDHLRSDHLRSDYPRSDRCVQIIRGHIICVQIMFVQIIGQAVQLFVVRFYRGVCVASANDTPVPSLCFRWGWPVRCVAVTSDRTCKWGIVYFMFEIHFRRHTALKNELSCTLYTNWLLFA